MTYCETALIMAYNKIHVFIWHHTKKFMGIFAW